jgi:hypothetical protein
MNLMAIMVFIYWIITIRKADKIHGGNWDHKRNEEILKNLEVEQIF